MTDGDGQNSGDGIAPGSNGPAMIGFGHDCGDGIGGGTMIGCPPPVSVGVGQDSGDGIGVGTMSETAGEPKLLKVVGADWLL